MWTPILVHLAGLPVYTLDTVGDVGWSVQEAPLTSRSDLVEWLDDVLDELDLARAHLVGASYGGWIACAYAARSPSRVATLTLVEPALERLRWWFWVHGFCCLGALLLPPPLRRRALHRLHADLLAVPDKRRKRLFMLAYTRFRRGTPPFAPVTDEDFAAVTVPTLLLLGEKSEVHHSSHLLRRAQRQMPNVRGEVVAGAGHSLPVDHADFVARYFRAFVGETVRD
jgi:pimeloyl-ACP methyl ester carboxylesterase